jgi:two-component system chemotaxis response regulator CheY
MWSCFDRGHDSTRKVFAGVDVLKKVLIVDDSVSMRQMVSFTLREGGFEVIEAEHGQDALDKLQGASVDLVITDLNMPVMDGITLIQNLRKQPAMKTKPILMLTTEGLAGKKEQGKAAGATGWIVKPFDPEKLLQTVAKVLP